MNIDRHEKTHGRDAATVAMVLTSYVMIVLDIAVVMNSLPLLPAELERTDAARG
tara:strand:+ start:819 stop:980 length:162 start_codon:yes stop_codon:yes gene_type:complete